MKLNSQKWLDEIKRRNSGRNQTFLVMNDKCFFYLLILIPEEILQLDIPWIRLDVFFTFCVDFMVLWDTLVIYVYIYIYIYIYIFVISVDTSGKRVLNTLIRKGRAMISYRNSPKLTNLLLKVSPYEWRFSNNTWKLLLEVLLENSWSIACGRPVFLEELQAARKFSKVSLHFNKTPNSLKQVLQIYSEIRTCVLQKKFSKGWSQSAKENVRWNWSRCDEINLMVNLGQKYEGNFGY